MNRAVHLRGNPKPYEPDTAPELHPPSNDTARTAPSRSDTRVGWRALAPLLACLALAGTPGAAGAEDGDDFARFARQAFAPRRIALLIGVDAVDDRSFEPLSFAELDVARIAEVLADPEVGRFDAVTALTSASLAEATDALTELMRRVRRQDTVLVYFSGHGLAVERYGGAAELFLVLRDTSRGTVEDSGMGLHRVQEVLAVLPARKKVLLVDACFTGNGKLTAVPAGAAAVGARQVPLLRTDLPTDEAHLLSAGLGSPALELHELDGSLYTVHFVDALLDLRADLDGDGVVTVSEAHDHATDAVVEVSHGLQEPLALYRIAGREDLVLAGDEEQRGTSSMALLTTYDRRHAGLTLELAGTPKGVFPRSIPVEPGTRRVRFVTASGRIVDQGVFRFRPGQVVSVERVRSSFNGGFRFLHVTGAALVAPAPGAGGPAGSGPWFGAGYGHRARGPVGRHFVFRGELGAGGLGGAEEGSWALFSLAADAGFRLTPGRLSVELGPRLELDLLLPPGGPSRLEPALLMFAPGAHAALGVRVGNLVTLRVRYRLGVTHADLAEEGAPQVALLHRPGLELELGW